MRFSTSMSMGSGSTCISSPCTRVGMDPVTPIHFTSFTCISMKMVETTWVNMDARSLPGL